MLEKNSKTIKCKLYGLGGQGIKFLATTLGQILHTIGYEYITVNSDYDTVVRGGEIEASIIASHHKISSPIVEKADICIILTNPTSPIPAKTYIIDSSLENTCTKEKLNSKSVLRYTNFLHNSKGFPSNMLALKSILKELAISSSERVLKSALPPQNKKENIQALLSE